jgi:hypothetical protein
MRVAVEERLSDLVFESLDLAAQGRLREEHFLRRAADVGLLSDSDEVAELSEFHVDEHNWKSCSGKELGISRKERGRAMLAA